jgi:Casein kinase substrate phosphoprotein PP28
VLLLLLLLLLQEREVLEAERKKEHYLKLHAAGKTDEARADMERLAIVKARRAEQAKVLLLHTACVSFKLTLLCTSDCKLLLLIACVSLRCLT